MSTDSLESLRRKMLRQNRDLAKSNNVRALRIRELEGECACMLSENLELRGRILDLEKQVEDGEARRIADHALAIKTKLEAQLTEWGTLLAGLGLEPPMKKHSPRIRSSTKPRLSFSSTRPSPSQRRLRDVARDIEDLGHISENKTHTRMSLNPEQILALRSEADSSEPLESPDLGPPPVSQFINEDPVKVDSPARATPTKTTASATIPSVKSPFALSSQQIKSPQTNVEVDRTSDAEPEEPSPCKNKQAPTTSKPEPKPKTTKQPAAEPVPTPISAPAPATVPAVQPSKAGSKRKLSASQELPSNRGGRLNNENQTTKDRVSIRDKADGKTLKELTQLRKEVKTRPISAGRRPLASKSTNDDMNSPQKQAKPVEKVETAVTKAELKPAKSVCGNPKTKPLQVDSAPEAVSRRSSILARELGIPVTEPVLLSPTSPEPLPSLDEARGDTPPPADITVEGEMTRPSRRNRTAISYAEPNLRDKMRRPTKDLIDAVAADAKNSRRSSQSAPDMSMIKRESDAVGLLHDVPSADGYQLMVESSTMPASPLSHKGASPEDLVKPVTTNKPKRHSTAPRLVKDQTSEMIKEEDVESRDISTADTTGESGEIDPYEFTSSSPQSGKQEDVGEKRKSVTRSSRSSRRFSTIEGDNAVGVQERSSSRRRSMML
jgi:hypothetical protein